MAEPSPTTGPVIEARDLFKTFYLGLRRRKVEALRGVTFDVQPGEIFGFLGPNGAGKTTTIKIIVGLIRQTSGVCTLLGDNAGDIAARRNLGYLPESPYFYDHLLPDEFMDLCGRLRGLSAKERKRRSAELLERVGLSNAGDRPLRKFSKGMLQRIGLAQSLVGDPKLLILDEPMSGLDPVGRKEVRDLILEQRQRGKTVFFSSHILSDVETLCDRVAIIHQGRVVDQGTLAGLLEPEELLVDLELTDLDAETMTSLGEGALELTQRTADVVRLTVKGEGAADAVLRQVLDAGAKVVSVIPRRENLEELFLRKALKSGERPEQPST